MSKKTDIIGGFYLYKLHSQNATGEAKLIY